MKNLYNLITDDQGALSNEGESLDYLFNIYQVWYGVDVSDLNLLRPDNKAYSELYDSLLSLEQTINHLQGPRTKMARESLVNALEYNQKETFKALDSQDKETVLANLSHVTSLELI